MIRYYKPFFLLSLYDWFFGSWIAVALQNSPPFNQAANWAYQASYAVVVITALILSDRIERRHFSLNPDAWPRFIAGGLLFIGYAEDLLFYFLLAIWNPHGYQMLDGVFPDQIGGWLGWIGGVLLGESLYLLAWQAMALTAAAIALSTFILRKVS